MRTFKQHIPPFVDGYEPQIFQFEKLEDLLSYDLVARNKEREDFHQFSLSDNYLMVEYKNGDEWWVLGFIDDISGLELPKWQMSETGRRRVKEWNRAADVINARGTLR